MKAEQREQQHTNGGEAGGFAQGPCIRRYEIACAFTRLLDSADSIFEESEG